MLFSGLAQLDSEMDVIPDIARSWQVLEGGRRYLFHLRDDRLWSDGLPVTAADFEFAWKRNLNPSTRSENAPFLYDVVGAREYTQGTNPNPDAVRVQALDAYTLEVQLVEPVAYFPFITTFPVTFPLPDAVIERYGEDWGCPGRSAPMGLSAWSNLTSNMAANWSVLANYTGIADGNIGQIEWTVTPERAERLRAYLENRTDFTSLPETLIPKDIPKEEIYNNRLLLVIFLVFSPHTPPLDNPRVRKAFGHTLDRQRIYEQFHATIARGGLVPPGMPGHSPDIGLPFNVELGCRLLAEAGYPGGRNFPKLSAIIPHVFSKPIKMSYLDNGANIWASR